jgi:hypothetical protein
MSRAEWLAFGSAMVLAGCSAKETSVTLERAAPDAAISDGGLGISDGGLAISDGGLTISDGDFVCGDTQCVLSAQFCLDDRPQPVPGTTTETFSCRSYDSGDWSRGDATFAAAPTCASFVGYNGACASCSDNGAGGVTVIACHSCYGSPPARLERLGHHAFPLA